MRIAEQCRFSLDEIKYQFPAELVPDGHTAASWLRQLVLRGRTRTMAGNGVPENVETLLEHELSLIAELRYEHFFFDGA